MKGSWMSMITSSGSTRISVIGSDNPFRGDPGHHRTASSDHTGKEVAKEARKQEKAKVLLLKPRVSRCEAHIAEEEAEEETLLADKKKEEEASAVEEEEKGPASSISRSRS